MKSTDCRIGYHTSCTGNAGKFLPSMIATPCDCVCHENRVLTTKEVLELGNTDCEVKPIDQQLEEDEGFIWNGFGRPAKFTK